ncbi:TonB-dependent receptor [Chloroherpeton thalassium ATCC 35110]|uniref:TonB-dependent receptor n=1 Tax=Chloroherpeton thalassium (strain ATCC 35110 / GB-78) TaxID=517418 RepID=B3QUX8_CHLT3|nr:TonB-dependent receptor plug domain-containing protein [Chloroherpeton thalassium]ACF14479.1 TonB-dependent receptor [Chloroherpeton thalassium ATCC 35110]
MKHFIFLAQLLVLSLLLNAALAQNRGGMLRGTMTHIQYTKKSISTSDSLSGETQARSITIRRELPLVGATVKLNGTTIQARTDSAGKYFIGKIPRGLYDILYQADGFETDLFRNVFIKNDTITEIDILLFPILSAAQETLVTLSRVPQKLSRIPLSVELLDLDFIQQRNTATLDDALRFLPGVTFSGSAMQIRASPATDPTPNASARQSLTIDQTPVQAALNPQSAWDLMPLNFLDRLELGKGAFSGVYGNGALDGALNAVTGSNFASKTMLRTYAGIYSNAPNELSDWTNNTQFLSGTEVAHVQSFGKFNAYASAGYFSDEGYRENGDAGKWRLFSKSLYQFAPRHQFSLLAGFTENRQGGNTRWINADSALFDASAAHDERYSNLLFLAPTYEFPVSRVTTFALRGRYIGEKLHNQSDFSLSRKHSGLEIQTTLDLGSGYYFTAGFDGYYTDLTANSDSTRTAKGFAIFLQSENPLVEPIRITYGLRYDGLWADQQKLEGKINPHIGLSTPIGKAGSAWTNFRLGFRFPTLAERFFMQDYNGISILPNESLKLENSLTYELGYRYDYIRPIALSKQISLSSISFETAFFYNSFSDMILLVETDSGDLTYQNASSDLKLLGLELTTHLNFNKKLLCLSLSYTYTHSPKTESADAWAFYRRNNLFYGDVLINLGRLSFGFDYRYVSGLSDEAKSLWREVFSQNGTEQAMLQNSAHVLDVKFGMRVFEGVSANLVAKNILNEVYLESPALLASLRNISLQLNAEF